ncbi:hemolysin family protein [Cryptosporangium minutisporangium]|uniref:Hemolysin family protein n=1 Tax=Cryptosporangium minutisporangium TaxID=113569 RepID=A0ABP6T619_9ACTN
MLTAANAFFVAAEFSLVTVDRASIEEQAAQGDRSARRLSNALHSLSFQLSGAQLGITLSALLTGYLAEPAIAQLLHPLTSLLPGSKNLADGVAVAIALLLATLISMLFGELVPKNAALARPRGVALWTAGPLRVFSTILRPIIAVLNGTANIIVRRLGIEPQEELASARSPEELGLLAAISARAGALPTETATLLQRTIRFGDKRAAEAMTPRVDVVGLEATATVDDLLALATASGHTRFPIYIDTLDQVVGVVGVIDALGVPAQRRSETLARSISRDPVLVPESLDLDGVLAALRAAGAELAVVVDEYGGTDGIVTTEDLVEELVGEIDDEYDPPTSLDAPRITAPDADQARLVPGLLREDELAEETGFRLPDGPYETLAGFVMSQLGRIPVEGERVEFNGWTFIVTSVERHRIEQVKVRPAAEWLEEQRARAAEAAAARAASARETGDASETDRPRALRSSDAAGSEGSGDAAVAASSAGDGDAPEQVEQHDDAARAAERSSAASEQTTAPQGDGNLSSVGSRGKAQ